MNKSVPKIQDDEPIHGSVKEMVEFFENNCMGQPQPVPTVLEPVPRTVAQCMKALNLNSSKLFVRKKPASSSSSAKFFANSSKPESSHSSTPSPQPVSSSSEYPKKTSTSTTDQNPSSHTLSSSKETTPASANSSTNEIPTSKQSTVKKSSHVSFQQSLDDSLNENQNMTVPEILEVFTDLDLFIERELNDMSTQRRVQKIIDGHPASVVDDIMKMKEEFLKDKQKYQKEFERQMKHESKFQTIEEEKEEDESSDSADRESLLTHQRKKKIEWLKREASKQEFLLTKINRVLERIKKVSDDNVASVVNIERHYLVASNRLQSAMSEVQRLRDPEERCNPSSFTQSGKCVISDVMLEVKTDYFEREPKLHNEFVVVMLKYGTEVYASKAICINDDIRVLKFPNKFRVPDAFVDFEMRLEIYGTTFWRKRHLIRETMLKKYGYVTFTMTDTGTSRKRFEMTEVITSGNNPLRNKVLMKIRQKITADVHFFGSLRVKLGKSWYKAQALLIGHLLEIALVDDEDDSRCDTMLLDLHNFDSDFIVPVVSRDYPPFTFLLRFNQYVNGTDFHLLVAAENAEDYANWINLINKALVLIRD